MKFVVIAVACVLLAKASFASRVDESFTNYSFIGLRFPSNAPQCTSFLTNETEYNIAYRCGKSKVGFAQMGACYGGYTCIQQQHKAPGGGNVATITNTLCDVCTKGRPPYYVHPYGPYLLTNKCGTSAPTLYTCKDSKCRDCKSYGTFKMGCTGLQCNYKKSCARLDLKEWKNPTCSGTPYAELQMAANVCGLSGENLPTEWVCK